MRKTMSSNAKIVYFFISTIFFVLFDKYLTNLILNNLNNLPQNPILDFFYVENTGAAFSILENYKWFLIIFAVLAILMIVISVLKNIKKASSLAVFGTAILIAGIFCNVYERIIFGYVRDFIKLNFVNFPVFNISDVFINIGVFAIVIIIIKNNYSNKINEDSN